MRLFAFAPTIVATAIVSITRSSMSCVTYLNLAQGFPGQVVRQSQGACRQKTHGF